MANIAVARIKVAAKKLAHRKVPITVEKLAQEMGEEVVDVSKYVHFMRGLKEEIGLVVISSPHKSTGKAANIAAALTKAGVLVTARRIAALTKSSRQATVVYVSRNRDFANVWKVISEHEHKRIRRVQRLRWAVKKLDVHARTIKELARLTGINFSTLSYLLKKNPILCRELGIQ